MCHPVQFVYRCCQEANDPLRVSPVIMECRTKLATGECGGHWPVVYYSYPCKCIQCAAVWQQQVIDIPFGNVAEHIRDPTLHPKVTIGQRARALGLLQGCKRDFMESKAADLGYANTKLTEGRAELRNAAAEDENTAPISAFVPSPTLWERHAVDYAEYEKKIRRLLRCHRNSFTQVGKMMEKGWTEDQIRREVRTDLGRRYGLVIA
jgi:hypothetical protein